MTPRRIGLAAVEGAFWFWHAALVVCGTHVAWTCDHQHPDPHAAIACAKQTRLVLRPQSRVVSLPAAHRARMAQRRLGR